MSCRGCSVTTGLCAECRAPRPRFEGERIDEQRPPGYRSMAELMRDPRQVGGWGDEGQQELRDYMRSVDDATDWGPELGPSDPNEECPF